MSGAAIISYRRADGTAAMHVWPEWHAPFAPTTDELEVGQRAASISDHNAIVVTNRFLAAARGMTTWL